jgi:glycosyltransferase involved in cell wall biosynthesis
VIPTYNYAHGVGRAIESVLAQTRPADEIVVVNDGSTDGTLAALAGFEPRVRVLSQSNSGAAAARNRGVRALNTDWVAFLDQDDEWLPEKLERQWAALESVPGVAYSTTGAYTFQDGRPTGIALPDPQRIAREFRYCNCFGFPGSSAMIRRDAFLELGGFREELKQYAEDWELGVRLYLRYPFCAVREPLIRCYENLQGASSTTLKMIEAESWMARNTLLEGLTGLDRFVTKRRVIAQIYHRAARNLPETPRQRAAMMAHSLLRWPLPLGTGPRLRMLAGALRDSLR